MMANVPETFRSGLAHHQAGEFERAEVCYHDVLRRDPRHSDALHLLGVIALQQGRHDKEIWGRNDERKQSANYRIWQFRVHRYSELLRPSPAA